MADLELSLAQVRRLMLAAQGLAGAKGGAAQKADVLGAIRQMGALQIDTISVVNRSPYFVLWSRLGAYEPAWLDELLAEGALFEAWGRAACFFPIEDYPLFHGRMRDRHPVWTTMVLDKYPDLATAILARIRTEGPLASSDFEGSERRPGGWWNWRDEKRVLEALFLTDDLMIAKRRNFQRLYDVPERVLPEWDPSQALPRADADRALVLKAVTALGVATPGWTRDCFHTKAAETARYLEELANNGKLLRARVEGIAGRAYIHPDNLGLVDLAASEDHESRTVLLSPFDPVVCDRRRALQLFDFDYKIECYTPAPQRKFGYFSLPILWRDRLVGRLDAKAHRRDGLFEVKSLFLEPGVAPTDELNADLTATLRDCAAWHGTPAVSVTKSDPPVLAPALNRLLAG